MEQPKTSGVAIAALVTGLLGLGLVPVILGHVALSGIKKSNGTIEGKGFAIAGLVLGYLSILAALVIIGLAVAIGVSAGLTGVGHESATEAKLARISAALVSYRALSGDYPSEAQGLGALVEEPTGEPVPRRWERFFHEVPQDAWGNEFEYKYPGTKDPKSPEVISPGTDGVLGTGDDLSSQDPP